MDFNLVCKKKEFAITFDQEVRKKGFHVMLTKITSKNQITLPKKIMAHFESAEYFDVREKSGTIILTPVKITRGDAVRDKLELLGINQEDIKAAIQWAHK